LPYNVPLQMGENMLEKLYHAITDFKAGPGKDAVSPDVNAKLDKIQEQIKPSTIEIPEKMTDVMKYAMSGADWTKENGIYGFTKDQWDDVKTAAPDLGLTDNGRISKNLDQQEKAMDWYLRSASQDLTEKDIKVDKASLYGAFKLGIDQYEAISKAPNNTKIKAVIGDDVLAKNPEVAQFKTVGQVKEYLKNEVEKATAAANSPNKKLTQQTNNAEDKP